MTMSAFPVPLDDRPGAYPAEPGMTLRDYFAARAVQYLCAEYSYDLAARKAYELADAMMAAREPSRAVPATENDRRLVDLAHTYLREALKLDVGEPMRFDYYAHMIGGLQAKLDAAEAALRAQEEAETRDDQHIEMIERMAAEGWDEATGASHIVDDWRHVSAAYERAAAMRRAALSGQHDKGENSNLRRFAEGAASALIAAIFDGIPDSAETDAGVSKHAVTATEQFAENAKCNQPTGETQS